MQKSLYNDAEIHTPYGATECLPISSVSATGTSVVDAAHRSDALLVRVLHLGHLGDPRDLQLPVLQVHHLGADEGGGPGAGNRRDADSG